MSTPTRFDVSPSVVTREIGGEVMLLDLDNGSYFGLDPVGAEIWRSLEDGEDVPAILDRIEQDFDVAPDQLRRDVDALLGKLVEHNLVTAAA